MINGRTHWGIPDGLAERCLFFNLWVLWRE